MPLKTVPVSHVHPGIQGDGMELLHGSFIIQWHEFSHKGLHDEKTLFASQMGLVGISDEVVDGRDAPGQFNSSLLSEQSLFPSHTHA